MRRPSALAALLAVLLHTLAPLVAGAAPGGATQRVELCTAHGVVTIEVPADADGAPALAAPDHCQSCASHCAAAPAAGGRGALPPVAGTALRAPVPQFDCRTHALASCRPRAPPVAS